MVIRYRLMVGSVPRLARLLAHRANTTEKLCSVGSTCQPSRMEQAGEPKACAAET